MVTKKKLKLRNPLKGKHSPSKYDEALKHVDQALTLIPSVVEISEAFKEDNERELSDVYAGVLALLGDIRKALPKNAPGQNELDAALQALPTPRGVMESFKLYAEQDDDDTTDYPAELLSATNGAAMALESLRGALTDEARLKGLSICMDCGYLALSPALVSAHGITKRHKVTSIEALRETARRPAVMPGVPLKGASQLDRASKAAALAKDCLETYAGRLGSELRNSDTATTAYRLADQLRDVERQIIRLAGDAS
ncbi:hypothetical protein [Corallococcus sp. EGB]|uniref:hypothetical protein n=1 Tax=Corallococcus sp. EGB TaxID=1521117 RepID=UPI001CC03745|nr:hypothetical protein [Corallococcus sp. EGB]